MKLRVIDIVAGTSVDGPGLRTSIYLAGCRHYCIDCHNPQSWSFDGGNLMSVDEIMSVVREEEFNVTLSGGDPMYSASAVLPLLRALKSDDFNVWVYTGFLWEELLQDAEMSACLPFIDVIVDGRFEIRQRDTALLFRGSANQRVIDVPESLRSGKIVILPY